MTGIARDLARKYDLIHTLASNSMVDMQTLQGSTALPASTIRRLLAILRHDFGMDIEFERTTGVKGGKGFYKIKSWGILDRSSFLNFWAGVDKHACD
ncbi:helix-turn-helix domain-containing protein (plasmid) [Comamonas aquatica]|nr:helix-turn-helix domain-containing protein [Comamonas aquatica]